MVRNKLLSSFTFLEITIWLALVAVIALTALILFNPFRQIAKAWDGKRKSNLSTLQKILEDWYNDKGCYPKPTEICYKDTEDNAPATTSPCYICGTESTSPSFSPYLSQLPCDPQHPTKEYLYEIDNNDCPTWYRIYSELTNTDDPDSERVGCMAGGCGHAPFYGYDYGVASPNTGLQTTGVYICLTNDKLYCNACGLWADCHDPVKSPGCQIQQKFYSSHTACCQANNNCEYTYYCWSDQEPSVCTYCGHTASECNNHDPRLCKLDGKGKIKVYLNQQCQ